MERKEGRGSEEDGEEWGRGRMERKEGEREAVGRRMERKGEKGSEGPRTTTLINFPRLCLQWFLKIDQSECSKSPIDLHQRNNTCVVPHSEQPQS
jgi:hypothetical protein